MGLDKWQNFLEEAHCFRIPRPQRQKKSLYPILLDEQIIMFDMDDWDAAMAFDQEQKPD